MPNPDSEPPQKRSLRQKQRDSFDVISFGCRVGTMMASPITRTHHGERSFWPAPYAFVAMLLYAATQESEAMYCYIAAWTCMTIYRRIRADPEQHSRYMGCPFTAAFFANEANARAIEAGLVGVAGIAVAPFSAPLGGFLMFLYFPMTIKEGIDRQVEYMQIRTMKDAEITMRHRMDRFRG